MLTGERAVGFLEGMARVAERREERKRRDEYVLIVMFSCFVRGTRGLFDFQILFEGCQVILWYKE